MSNQELIAIRDEARLMAQEDRDRPIIDCPVCGETLDVRGDIRNCPLGHYRQTGAQRGPESI